MALLMEDESTIQKNIAEKLIAALKTGGFVLYAQKILRLAASAGSERPFQEILVRFREEEEKLLPPGTFFPMLQEYRLLPYVDRWVVSRLASWIQESRAGERGWTVPTNGVNLSEDTLREPKFADFVAKHIENAKLPDEVFTFELGWDTALLHAEQLKGIQARLEPLGCRFTFAGFDGSAGSFEFLKVLRPDFVKLTYGVVKDVDRGLAACEKVEAINHKCHAMGIKTIAEFVESHEVLDQLRLIEVDFAQGLIIGGPQKLA
ncbi:MAG TPA: EAL domain-containing protein [Burkholderiales bacterium]|jgi:EAL domain-containing protein (putative c-di-GMP-specific phosphodiesterase class I)|nr:EAL domain-containing protein [Burkholderiales bacterium]